jgi:hypothetical protein
MTKRPVYFGIAVAGCKILAAAVPRTADRDPSIERVAAAENDIAGVVTGPKGPEAGVWVIAETSDLPT